MSNLSVDLTGLTSGTVKFTMPSKDVKDAALSGSLKYTVRLNGEVAATGTAAAGAAVNTNFTTTVSGMTNVTVTADCAIFLSSSLMVSIIALFLSKSLSDILMIEPFMLLLVS